MGNDSQAPRPTVAVIGLGALGLVTLKNLLEEDFDATGYEKNSYVGGLWKFVDGPQTSVLESTRVNIAIERGSFTDFPFPKDTPSFPSGEDVGKYLDAYALHFSLYEKIHLNIDVRSVRRDETLNKWELEIVDQAGHSSKVVYDKVILATGMNAIPSYPDIPGLDKFKGDVIHSISYKRPTAFEKKKVLVVGLSNSGADTATTLMGHAEKIYLSHRNGAYILPRILNGKPVTHGITHKMQTIAGFFQMNLPFIHEKMMAGAMTKLQNTAFSLDPKWKFSPPPPARRAIPVVSDNLVDELHAGNVISVTGIKEVLDDRTVEFSDGTQLSVDAIILCTGYKPDFSILSRDADPTRNTTKAWAAAIGSGGKPLPRLYRNIISLDFPDSLAVMGAIGLKSAAFVIYDLASMALAQIWKGNSSLPSVAEMSRHVDKHHEWMCSLAEEGSVYPATVKDADWMWWANDTAGTGVNEHLGYGLPGWSFWYRDPAFCDLLMNGVATSYMYRVFDTEKRKAWAGAQDAIERVNHSGNHSD